MGTSDILHNAYYRTLENAGLARVSAVGGRVGDFLISKRRYLRVVLSCIMSTPTETHEST